jgi:hypothetical protein
LLVVVAAWSMLVAASCKRPLGQDGEDAGDAGVPINIDGARADVPRADVAADAPAATRSAPTSPATWEAKPPSTPDATSTWPPSAPRTCRRSRSAAAAAAARRWGGPATTRRLASHATDIPNPVPPPHELRAGGCSFGVRHVCCADPATPPGVLTVCANNTSDEDYPRFQVTTRDGGVCTTLELAVAGETFRSWAPDAYSNAMAWRGPV